MRTAEATRDLLGSPLPPDADRRQVLRWAVAHACAAPSELNSQPWHFDVQLEPEQAVVELTCDRSRRLDVIDPDGREALLACGAALLNLRLALRGAQVATHVALCPDPHRPELLARVVVSGSAQEDPMDRPLRLAIPERGTHRGAFDPGAVREQDVAHLVAAAALEGAAVAVLGPAERAAFADLTARAESELWEHSGYRREVAAWSGPSRSTGTEGAPRFAHSLVGWTSWLHPSQVRFGGNGPERDDVAPLVLVVASAGERREDLLRAGAGLQRLLLRARTMGLAASYLNAPLHVPERYRELARLTNLDHPQLVLRIGYAEPGQRAPRRPETAVLDVREGPKALQRGPSARQNRDVAP